MSHDEYSELDTYRRLPSRLASTICGPPVRTPALGCEPGAAIPPRRTLPVSLGANGSLTSYWRKSPVPQHDTYRKRSSSDRLMSVTSGGTAPNPFSSGGSSSASAGSAGIVITFWIFQSPPSRCHIQIDADRSSTDTTTPTNPYVFCGSWAGRSSSTIWC